MAEGNDEFVVPEGRTSRILLELPGAFREMFGVFEVGEVKGVECLANAVGDGDDIAVHTRNAKRLCVRNAFHPVLDGFRLVGFQQVELAVADEQPLTLEGADPIALAVERLVDDVRNLGFRTADIVPGDAARMPVHEHVLAADEIGAHQVAIHDAALVVAQFGGHLLGIGNVQDVDEPAARGGNAIR